MQKAIVPGVRRMSGPTTWPFLSINSPRPMSRLPGPSTPHAIINKLQNIIGAKKKMLLNGLLVAGFRSSKIWVNAQRKPLKKAAEMTRMKPRGEKSTSPLTIMMTPKVIVAMMRTSFKEGDSRRKRKAKRSTKAREEDLHIATGALEDNLGGRQRNILTVERQSDELEGHIAQSNVQTGCDAAGTETGEVEHLGHERFVF